MKCSVGCTSGGALGGWTTLIDGNRGLDNFNRVGEANWSGTDGAVQASQGGKEAAFLVTRGAYKDVMIRAEFWASDDANSGIFFRCQDAAKITDENCYEANTFEISARGTRLVVLLNGVKTVDMDDAKLASGPIALQWGRGTIKFRKLEVRSL